MKRMILPILLLCAIFAAALWHSAYLFGVTEELTAQLEQAEARAEAGDWDAALKLTQDAQNVWTERDTYLHILLRHSETDSIYTGFREVAEFIQCQESGEYSAANARLIGALELLAEAEKLTLQNVL